MCLCSCPLRQNSQLVPSWLRCGLMPIGAAWAVVLGTIVPFSAAGQARRLSQSQEAGQFLQAILRADYRTAYGHLAPEVRQGITLGQFAVVARPLWKAGQQSTPRIELYKLGMRLGDGSASRLFYDFSFAADSVRKPPLVLLEVTFRDTASRAVLGFSLRPGRPLSKPGNPVGKPKK
jgi:hypothetical protein